MLNKAMILQAPEIRVAPENWRLKVELEEIGDEVYSPKIYIYDAERDVIILEFCTSNHRELIAVAAFVMSLINVHLAAQADEEFDDDFLEDSLMNQISD